MTLASWRVTSGSLRIALVLVLSAACGGASEPAPAGSTATPAAGSKEPAPPQVNACTLFSKAEIEAAAGRPVRDPAEETLANLSTCGYGDPNSPLVAGRSQTKTVALSVVSGDAGYFEGPVAQTAALYEMAVKNAGEIQQVSGLGDKAHWASSTLRVLRGAYMLEVEVDAGDASRKIAEQLARMAIERLPKSSSSLYWPPDGTGPTVLQPIGDTLHAAHLHPSRRGG